MRRDTKDDVVEGDAEPVELGAEFGPLELVELIDEALHIPRGGTCACAHTHAPLKERADALDEGYVASETWGDAARMARCSHLHEGVKYELCGLSIGMHMGDELHDVATPLAGGVDAREVDRMLGDWSPDPEN